MSRILILVVFIFNFSLLFAQDQDPNKNIFSQDELIILSNYGKQLENLIIEKNPSDTAIIAKLKGDYLSDLYGYTDDEVIKISNYLKVLEIQDSINNIPEQIKELEEVIVKLKENVDPLEGGVKEKSILAEIEEESLEIFITTILFDVNKSQPKAIDLFDFVYDLKLDKKLKVILVGHTDGSGSDNYNLDLSVLRAVNVKKYLVKQGIVSSRIDIRGEGEWQPVADNATKEGRASNRRVEVTVR